MGKPAARQGDMTVHGGTITVGCPTVLIGGMPAARVGDMHTCPMQTPAVPSPIPHVGGPVLPPGAVTVLIGGVPAACVGDMCVCTGPPDSIAPPGCPTVMIGQGGGGGGGGGAGGSGGGGEADASADSGEAEESQELNVTFEDKGGFPVSGVGYSLKDPDGKVSQGILAGLLRKVGKEGSYEISLKAITQAAWSSNLAEVGDKVKLKAEVVGIDDGEKATLTIMIHDSNFADRAFEVLEAKVSSGKIEADWELEISDRLLEDQDDRAGKNYSSPSFYFVVRVAGIQQRSGYLKYKDWVEIEMKDDDGEPLSNREYKAYLSDGSVRKGYLDRDGKAKLENVPPGRVEVSVDVRNEAE